MRGAREYRMRTPIGYWIVMALLGLLAAASLALLTFSLGLSGSRLGLQILMGALVFLPLGYWLTTPQYRIGSGAGLLRILEETIEVPASSGSDPIVFRREGLELTWREVLVELRLFFIPITTIRRGALLELRSPGLRRRISTLTLVDEGAEEALWRDLHPLPTLATTLEGLETPMAGAGRQAGEVDTTPEDEYEEELDRRIDRELG